MATTMQVMPRRRRPCVVSPSLTPTEQDPVRHTEVDKESDPGGSESGTESVPRSEPASEVEIDPESQIDFVPCSQGMCIEGASRFPPWCVQVGHATGVARDCEWHGASESVADSESLETVHLSSENVVVPTCTRWQSPPKPASGPSEQICQRTLGPSLEQEQ